MAVCQTEVNNLFVTSELRDTTLYPNGNNYTLHLTTPIKDIEAVELIHASIPNSLYNLGGASNTSSNTNFIGFSDIDVVDGTPHYYNIAPGFYSATSLQQQIQNTVKNQSNVSVTYLYSEGKFLFTRDEAFPFEMKIGNATTASLLGFDNVGTNYNSISIADPALGGDVALYANNSVYRGKEWIKSDTIVNMHPNEGIFLDIKELRTNFNSEAMKITDQNNFGTYSGMNMNRTFGMIPMDVSGGVVKAFKKTSDYDFKIDYPYPINRLDRLTIEWVDRFGRTVNFNGVNDHSFILRFHTSRKNLCA